MALTLRQGKAKILIIKDFNNIPNELVNVSGVYVLSNKENNKFYVGSASSLSTRFKQHILNSSRPYRGGNNKFYSFVKENGGWDNMYGQVILTTTNHIIKFTNENFNYKFNLNKLSFPLVFNSKIKDKEKYSLE